MHPFKFKEYNILYNFAILHNGMVPVKKKSYFSIICSIMSRKTLVFRTKNYYDKN